MLSLVEVISTVPPLASIIAVRGEVIVLLFPQDVVNKIKGVNYDQLMLEPGDGSVTKPSLLGKNTLDPSDRTDTNVPIAYSFFICRKHDQLPGDITFVDNILNILIRSGHI